MRHGVWCVIGGWLLLTHGVLAAPAAREKATSTRSLKNKKAATRMAAAAALGEKGPAAAESAPALAALLRDSDPGVREKAADALSKIGPAAVPALLELLKKGDANPKGPASERDPAVVAIAGLERLDPRTRIGTAIPALAELMAQGPEVDKVWNNALAALCRLGPEAVPALVDALKRGIGLTDLFTKLGEAARPAAGRMIEGYPTLSNFDRWEACQALAAAKPGGEHIPAILKLMKEDEYGLVQDLGIVLDRIGPASVPALATLLTDKDWYPRWAATMALELMGPKAKAALPALGKAFKDDGEDIDVRVGAARAIASIQGTDPFELYQEIPDVEARILKAAQEKSMARRQEFMQREAARTDFLQAPDSTEERWKLTASWVYCLATNQQVSAANASLKQAVTEGSIGNFMDVNVVRAFLLCHSKSEHFPGRLEPETEAAMKQYFFNHCDTEDKAKGEEDLSTKELTAERAFTMGMLHNKPMNFTSRDYLALGVLKDDPDYKDRKFRSGDTVAERYEAWNGYWREFLRDWSLYGLWIELGSSNYEYHTYPSMFNLADLAPDPVVRQRAKMLLDLWLIEAQEFTIAGLRAGSKCRCKRGGQGSNFNPYLHMLYGERGRPLFHAPAAVSSYQPPAAAVLLHKLGAPVPVFEMANRQAGESDGRGDKTIRLDSHMINYAYRTPDYVMGCSMYDPNREYSHGCQGRWSGVVFSDRSILSLDAYTGEKWNVQSKDVMIAQWRRGSYYGGIPRIDFTSGFEKKERDGWLFLDNGEAFAAVNVIAGGYVWNDPAKSSLTLNDGYSPILIQTGRAKTYGSFERFQEAILQAPLKLEHAPGADPGKPNTRPSALLGKIEYTGPHSSKVEFFLDTDPFRLPTVDGKPIDLELEDNYVSPYLQNREGSDIVTVQFGSRKWDYDFAKNTVTAVKQ